MREKNTNTNDLILIILYYAIMLNIPNHTQCESGTQTYGRILLINLHNYKKK